MAFVSYMILAVSLKLNLFWFCWIECGFGALLGLKTWFIFKANFQVLILEMLIRPFGLNQKIQGILVWLLGKILGKINPRLGGGDWFDLH
jgi:hypothetical protein